MPESPRWHFSLGRDEKGKQIAQVFAKKSNVVLTEQDWHEATVEEVRSQQALCQLFYYYEIYTSHAIINERHKNGMFACNTVCCIDL